MNNLLQHFCNILSVIRPDRIENLSGQFNKGREIVGFYFATKNSQNF